MLAFRAFALASIAACSALALSSTFIYKVTVNGKVVGSAKVERTGNDVSGYAEHSQVKLQNQGQTFSQIETDDFGKDGVSKSVSSVITIGRETVNIHATFSKTAAYVSMTASGVKATKKTVPMEPNVRHLDVNHYWFSHIKPTVGQSITAQTFSTQGAKWQIETSKFIGKQKIVVNGKSVMANAVTHVQDGETSTQYVDDQGELLLLKQNGGLQIERVSGS